MNVSMWEDMYRKRLQSEFHQEWREKESTYASYAYDATWVYARALEKYVAHHPLEAIHTHANTHKFMHFLRQVTFRGVSGNLAFKKNTSGAAEERRALKTHRRSAAEGSSGAAALHGASDSSDREDTFVYLQQNFLGERGNKKVAQYINTKLTLFGDEEVNPGFAKIYWPNGHQIKDLLEEIR